MGTESAKNSGSGRRAIHGVLLLDKPLGLSSNQALQCVRRIFEAAKAGHTGSLDPLATGMLPICFGEATKLTRYMLSADKTYRVIGSLGTATSTGDAEGEVVAERRVPQLSAAEIERVLAGFVAELEQIPPMYSALKHEGRRLYQLARAGLEVDRAPRKITIYDLEVLRYEAHQLELEIRCSKGTYVRTLVEDIAAALGTVGHVTALRRLALGHYASEPMTTMAALEDLRASDPAALDRLLLPVDSAIATWPRITVASSDAERLTCGQAVRPAAVSPPGLVRLYTTSERFFGVGEILSAERLVPRRIFPGLSPWS